MKKFTLLLTTFLLFYFSTHNLLARDKFPVNTIKDLNGKTQTQQDFLSASVPTFVLLFRTWCPASELQLIELLHFQEELKEKNPEEVPFELICVGLDRIYGYTSEDNFKVNTQAITEFAVRKKLKLNKVFEGNDSFIREAKNIRAPNLSITPSVVIVDSNREIFNVPTGFQKSVVLEEVLKIMKKK